MQAMSSSMPKVSPTESFLRYLTLPEDESEFVELQHCAVVLVSHLDRLAAPYLPVSSNQKVLNDHVDMPFKILSTAYVLYQPSPFYFLSSPVPLFQEVLRGFIKPADTYIHVLLVVTCTRHMVITFFLFEV